MKQGGTPSADRAVLVRRLMLAEQGRTVDMKHQGAVRDMSIEEKLALLPDIDKAYLRGYLDRALFETRRTKAGNYKKKKGPFEPLVQALIP
ncbi:hypothetical protein AGMMS50230_01830 [Spirochaetia bacterium]|nr:hypothetical protein AGMMS50230_01830 [Spirochaetia bacterium]